MFEKVISQIILELGPTGLLIIGLYFSIAMPLKNLTKQLEGINKETFPSKDVIIDCTEKICRHLNG